MYNPYIPSEGWYSVEPEPQQTPENGFLGSLLSRFGLGGGQKPPERPLFEGIPFLEKLDSGDILLILLLYLLYRETEDEEWLIILAAVLFSGG